MCLAYTSFAVRMLQGRDILQSTAAALTADALADLCERFRARGIQLDLSQLESHEASYLTRVRDRVERAGLSLELSVPSRYLESAEAYQEIAALAGALGVDRIRVALLYGRRYESFENGEAWAVFNARWRTGLARLKPVIERHPVRIGIENHKDFRAGELADLLRTLDSPQIGATVDFGNNLSLLEDPLETIRTLAPFAITTHLKDMAVTETGEGFELSEVPLGEGLVPLAEGVRVLREASPDVRFTLEMITRDPLPVPYRTDRFWRALNRPPDAALARFERDVLGRAQGRLLPRVSHLDPEAQIAAEDENVRRCLRYARENLKL